MSAGEHGFFTDTTVCIGCKACETACKQWNQLPEDGLGMTGMSYDNTGALGASTWRHVAFIERQPAAGGQDAGLSWLFASDVCKHCTHAGCLENCPTGAIVRTEFDTVYVQPDVCNGCGYCVAGCPFGVIERQEEDGRAWKCTLCYDRTRDGLEPACAKACPTDSIQYGDLDELRARAEQRVRELQVDRPEVYNLPPDPVAPSRRAAASWRAAGLAAAGLAAAALGAALGGRR
jgi:formate dehydrogenase iron-sulfur subunit